MKSKIEQYRKKFLEEMNTDENTDYRRGFYAGCLMAALELEESDLLIKNEIKPRQTLRGFDYYTFKDSNDNDYSLQKSSSAECHKIWLGLDKCDCEKDAITELLAAPRMHLTQEQVKKLLPILQRFVETGEIS